ncbi:MAG: hypothetical protein LBC33_00705 [Mycoplasmataceae bacterium]|nr:hypothetical protein [Mycoplasmataceae bacterium]
MTTSLAVPTTDAPQPKKHFTKMTASEWYDQHEAHIYHRLLRFSVVKLIFIWILVLACLAGLVVAVMYLILSLN